MFKNMNNNKNKKIANLENTILLFLGLKFISYLF